MDSAAKGCFLPCAPLNACNSHREATQKLATMIKPNHSASLDLPVTGDSRERLDWQSLAVSAQFRPGRIATLCGVSARTVQRYFRRSYGCTLGEWLRTYRLEIAYQKLVGGEPIKCVAMDLGYKQLSHFSRDFKRQYGCAPRFLDSNSSK